MSNDTTHAAQSATSFLFAGTPTLFSSTVEGICKANGYFAAEAKYGQEERNQEGVFPAFRRLRDPNKVGVMIRPPMVNWKEGCLLLVGYAQPDGHTLVNNESQRPEKWTETWSWLVDEMTRRGNIVGAVRADVAKGVPRRQKGQKGLKQENRIKARLVVYLLEVGGKIIGERIANQVEACDAIGIPDRTFRHYKKEGLLLSDQEIARMGYTLEELLQLAVKNQLKDL